VGSRGRSGQFEQVLLNLFLNASEAMPEGGTLSLRTRNALLDKEYTEPHRVPAGRFVHVSVADTGIGMDDETLRRIFEPFFTTKGMGRGQVWVLHLLTVSSRTMAASLKSQAK